MWKRLSTRLRGLIGLVVLIGLISPTTIAGAASFNDVPSGHLFETEIGWLADEGITLGCNPPVNDLYCPDDDVTRGQMAAFLVRALVLVDQDPVIDFSDDDGSVFEDDIEKLATAGITLGCNPPANDLYCPDDTVTRGQMAAFLYRALATSTPPPPPPPVGVEVISTTVSTGVVGEPYVEALEASGGTPPYAWAVISGDLPSGITLSSGGDLAGSAADSGTYNFTVQASDTLGDDDVQALVLVINPEPLTVVDVSRVSVAPDGTDSLGGSSDDATLSASGQYIAFESLATNLVPNDTNGSEDIFLRDLDVGTTVLVSVSSAGVQGNASSAAPAIAPGGQYVAFESDADNLVSGDTNGTSDIFVHAISSGSTVRVSVASSGDEALTGGSDDPSISAGGRFVAFESDADDLVPGDLNNERDVFVHDTKTGATKRVSVASDGTEGDDSSVGPDISNDGRFVVFRSFASNMVVGDTNAVADMFVHDLKNGSTERVSVSSLGDEAIGGHNYDPAISPGGRFVAWESEATNLVPDDTNGERDVFMHDMQTGLTSLISITSTGDQTVGGSSYDPQISFGGRYVAFRSRATNLVDGDTNALADVFVRDTLSGTTKRVSVTAGGAQVNGESDDPAISADGRYIAFESVATDQVADDTNALEDVFVVELFL